MSNGIEFYNPPDVAPGLTYSHAARAGDFIFLAGQIAKDENGEWVGGDATSQAKQVYRNIDRILAYMGATRRDVVKVNTILVDWNDKDAVTAVRLDYFGDHRPPPTAHRRRGRRLGLPRNPHGGRGDCRCAANGGAPVTVAMYDPAKLYRANRAEFDAAIVRVLESGKIDWGAEVPAFEAEFGDWLGARHAIGVGSGGVCATEDAELADRIRKLSADGQERARHHASPRPLALHHETEGENSRLHEIQAAILRVKLPGSDNTLAMRRAQAARYSEALAGLPADLPHVVPGCIHAWRNYVIEVEDRAALAAHLAGQGIGSDALYSPPMHVQPVYASLGYGEGSLPATERSCSRVLSLPIGPHLTLDDIDTVAAAVRTGLV